ncbi:MAG: polymer-forming cytoskeletal protein [Anaerolineales bacterium]
MWGREKSKPEAQPQAQPSTARPTTNSKPIETTIGPNTYIKGQVQGDGGLRVEGVVEGNIETTGNMVITESAKVLAEVKANNLSIAGAVKGNVHANRVEILATGRVWGDLDVKSILTNEGAYVSGKIEMPQDLEPPDIEPPRASRPGSPPKPAPKPEEEEKK